MMKGKEKLIATAVAACVGVALLYAIVNGMLLSPARMRNQRITKLTAGLAEARRARDISAAQAARLNGLAQRAIGTDENIASERLRVRLATLLQRSGLAGEGTSLKPISGIRLKGYYIEVGWDVSAKGSLKQIVDLLYLLDAEPYMHRVDGIVFTPQDDDMVGVKFRHTALVLPEKKGSPLPSGEFADAEKVGDLAGEDRRACEGIVSRNLFRPYSEPPPAAAPKQAPAPPPPPPDAATRQAVVGLPTWAGQQEVQVRDTQSGEFKTYKIGEALAGGRIVMIDYRTMPMPNQADVLSGSRVVLAIGQDFWAVDLGRMLSDKWKLSAGDLPEELRGGQAGASGEGAAAQQLEIP